MNADLESGHLVIGKSGHRKSKTIYHKGHEETQRNRNRVTYREPGHVARNLVIEGRSLTAETRRRGEKRNFCRRFALMNADLESGHLVIGKSGHRKSKPFTTKDTKKHKESRNRVTYREPGYVARDLVIKGRSLTAETRRHGEKRNFCRRFALMNADQESGHLVIGKSGHRKSKTIYH